MKNTVCAFSAEMGNVWERELIVDKEGKREKHILVFREKVPERANLTIHLAARGARAEVIAVFLGEGKMRSKINFTVSHEAPDTFCRILFKAALFDESRVDFAGMLKIAKGADGSDSYLQARALLVSPKAMARLDPGLEILANNVKASHGATVGRLQEQDVFYLESRGLSKESAERMLVSGFFSDAFRLMPEEAKSRVNAFQYFL